MEVNLAAVPLLLQAREGEMECVLQYICEAEALAEDRSGAITHQQCAGAWPSMS